jgi:hypothetical protein
VTRRSPLLLTVSGQRLRVGDGGPALSAGYRRPNQDARGRVLRREGRGSRSREGAGESGEDRQVGVQRDPIQAAHAER